MIFRINMYYASKEEHRKQAYVWCKGSWENLKYIGFQKHDILNSGFETWCDSRHGRPGQKHGWFDRSIQRN